MVKLLMQEYNFEIDDIRWYLSSVFTERVLSYKDDRRELTRYIWAGSLEKELYNMEEVFLDDLDDQFQRGLLDEAHLRDVFSQIEASRDKRYR